MNENNESLLERSTRELKEYFEKKRAQLPTKNADEISEAIDSIMDSIHSLELERDAIKRLSFKADIAANLLPENVIPLRKPNRSHQHEEPYSTINDRRWILKIDCLIESQSQLDIHKMALELHSHSKRFAFIEYHSLDQSSRQSVHALMKLGAITLFVPNILDLTMGEQNSLLSVASEDSLQRPLLMVGSTEAFSHLRGEAQINIDLIMILARAYIKLGRPFHEYKSQGLVHYFLDTLAQNPT